MGIQHSTRASSITCPECKRTSHHPQDVFYGYCGNCHRYTGKPAGDQAELNKVGTVLCPMILTATNRPCLGQLVTSGIAGMNVCIRCGTWVGKTSQDRGHVDESA